MSSDRLIQLALVVLAAVAVVGALACILVPVAAADRRRSRPQKELRRLAEETGQRGKDWMGNEYPPSASKAVDRG